MATGVDQG